MNMWKKNEDGDMGIGTMIIFIAMVLVAAVAAALVINVAYNLQQQGQSTGDQAVEDVSSGFEVFRVVGTVSSNNIVTLELHARLYAGSQPVDISKMSVIIDSGANLHELAWTSDDFTAKNLDGSALSDSVIVQSDKINITLDISTATGTAQQLATGSTCTITLIPEDGPATIERFTTPETYTTTYVTLA